MKRFICNLRLFDEGAGAAPATAGMSGTAGDATGTSVNAGDATGTANGTPATSDKPSFEDLVKGDYKEEADRYIQNIIKGRIKDSKADKAMIQTQRDILSIVAAKYGVDVDDLETLKANVSDDDAYYEDKAMEEGLTVEQYKKYAQAEAKGRAYDAMMADQQKEQQMQSQVAAWTEEAEQVKQIFPDFDLRNEMQNTTFQKLLASGVPMENAYVSLHSAEIMQGAMQYTAREVRKATANEIAAQGARPRENASSAQAAATLKTDVSKMTRAEREELSRRAARGEMVYL